MALSLDSSIAVEALRRSPNPRVRERLEASLDGDEPVWVSSIVVHELLVGALKGDRASRDLERLDHLLSRLTVAEFTADDAISAARVRADLEKKGGKIGPLDTLIAGHALARDWTLVTGDVRHFIRVDGLTLIDWTRSDQPVDRLAALAPSRPPKDFK